eukprot:6186275-Pleurochrysis_carterae.AAC.5
MLDKVAALPNMDNSLYHTMRVYAQYGNASYCCETIYDKRRALRGVRMITCEGEKVIAASGKLEDFTSCFKIQLYSRPKWAIRLNVHASRHAHRPYAHLHERGHHPAHHLEACLCLNRNPHHTTKVKARAVAGLSRAGSA